MRKEQPLLSICIPTYNRCHYLKKSIDSIVIQEEFINGLVEVVVSDNASTDATKEFVAPYLEKYDNFYYSRNTENVRDKNFPIVLGKAHGILKRLCNDTLCFNNGALKYMCQRVKEYEKTRPFICWLSSNQKAHSELVSFRNGMREVSFCITAISCFSIWDHESIGIEEDIAGTELSLWQVRKALQLASSKDEIALVHSNTTYIQEVDKKEISYGLYHVFFENYFALLKPLFDNGTLSNIDKDYLEKDLLFNFFLDWCVKWKLQKESLQYSKTEDLCQSIYHQYHNKPYWQEYEKRFDRLYWKLRIRREFKKIFGRK